jgi:hypothetical protein
MPLSTPRFERDGVWRGDRSALDPSLYPSYQPSYIAPAYGAALETSGPTWVHGRLSYRRVENTGEAIVSQFAGPGQQPPYSGSRISSERLGYSADLTHSELGGLKGGLIYDLYVARLTSGWASIDAFATKKLTVSVDYDYYAPSYDADSIWNFFAGEPMNDVAVRSVYDATEKLSASASAHARIYGVRTTPDSTNSSPGVTGATNPSYFPSNGMPFDEGGTVAVRYRFGEGSYGARATGNFGDGGDRVGIDLNAERVVETRYLLRARTTLFQWNDKLRPDRDATSFAYVAGVGYRFGARARSMFELEHDMNRLVGHRFRAMLSLTVAVTK